MKTIYISDYKFREKLNQQYLTINFILSFLCLLFTSTASANEEFGPVTITVTVSDKFNEEAIPFANVVVYQNKIQIAVSSTDIDGRCVLRIPSTGKYDFKAVYIGYNAMQVNNVELFNDKPNRLTIKLKGGETYITCCCTCTCFDRPSENWWPKLWTPYREAYAEWKAKREKREAKKSQAPPKASKTIPEEALIDSVSSERLVIAEPLIHSVQVFPNPCADNLSITSTQALQHLTLADANGKVLGEESLQNNTYTFNMSTYTNGIYYLSFSVNGKIETRQIVVLHP